MKKYIWITMLALGFSVFQSNAQQVLDEYLQTAAKNNPAIVQLFNAYMASLEKVPQVGALPDPQVAFAWFVQPIETRNGPQEFKISVSQMFPWFGLLNARENAAIQMAKAKYEAFEDQKSSVFYQVRSAYYNLYLSKKSIDISVKNIEILESWLNLTNVKVEAGIVSAVDVLRVEMELADIKNNLLLLQDEFEAQKVLFNNLLNVESDREIEVSDTLLLNVQVNKEALLDSVLNKNHSLARLDFERESLVYKEYEARKSGMPSFSIGVDYSAIGTSNGAYNGTDALAFPKLGVSVPLYRNKYQSMIKETQLLMKAKESEKEKRINELESIFEKAWVNYQDASRRVLLYQEQMKRAKQAEQLLEVQYATSGQNFEELLRMELKYLNYQLANVKSISDQHAAMAFVMYLAGKN